MLPLGREFMFSGIDSHSNPCSLVKGVILHLE